MDLLSVYKKILLIRAAEYKLDSLFKKGLVSGTAHFCIGQEFIPVIVSQYLAPDDQVTSTHRGHGHALAKGLELERFFAELTGRSQGYNSGKGGSQHVISQENSFFANGITGGMIPVGVGIAFADKYLKSKKIVVSYLGDGGFNEGYVQEALNLAKVLSLPILFVCENNQYAMSTSMAATHSAPIIDRVKSMGIQSFSVDDNDFHMLDKVAKESTDIIRSSSGPCFIEVKTYRHLGHSKNDKNLYRNKDEEKLWFERDALTAIEQELITSSQTSQAELEAIRNDIQNTVDKAAERALAHPKNSHKIIESESYI